MPAETNRATVYIDSSLHKALKMKAAETSRSVSDLINQAVRDSLAEDAEDYAAFENRIGEKLVSYGDMIKRLKEDGRI
jgi:predicted transcriptional regulator